MIMPKLAGWMLTLLLMVGLGFAGVFGKRAYDSHIRKDALEQAAIAHRDTVIAQLANTVQKTDTVWIQTRTNYVGTRDALVKANPTNVPLQQLAKKCDQLIISCDSLRVAYVNLVDTLQRQRKALEKLGRPSERRLTYELQGAWNFATGAPYTAGDVTLRVAAPMYVFGRVAGEPRQDAVTKRWQLQGDLMLGVKLRF